MAKPADTQKNDVAAESTSKTAASAIKPQTAPSFTSELKSSLNLLSKAVEASEPRFTSRVLRLLSAFRKKLQSPAAVAELRDTVDLALLKSSKIKGLLLPHLISGSSNAMQIDSVASSNSMKTLQALGSKAASGTATPTSRGPPLPCLAALPEHETFLSLLTILLLLDRSELAAGFALSSGVVTDYLPMHNRRSLDYLAAKIWFYHARLAELLETSGEQPEAWEAIRPALMAAHRTATLRKDEDTQATVLNLVLRNYLSHDMWEQADRLVDKSEFPEFGLQAAVGAGGQVPTGQVTRWLYYLGRIRAIQLNYTDAHAHLQQSIRRAPPAEVAPGFYQTAHKLFVVVELLMGDIPDRALFRHAVLKRALQPYFEIVQAVRAGDVAQFEGALQKHGRRFVSDQTYTLILRLRHNVIKTALRTISLAYSKIALKDVSAKLRLDSEEDAEYIVAKAIRDGVIEATLDHEKGYMKSKEVIDVYATSEPQEAFHQRISFCLKLHNESIKAMRFPLNAHHKELASAEEARERERELAQDILEGDEPADDPDTGPGPGF